MSASTTSSVTQPTTSPPVRGVEQIPNRIHARPLPHRGRWIAAVVLVVLAVAALRSVVTNPRFDWPIFFRYLRDVKVISGLGWTLLLTVASMAIAIVLAVTLAVMRNSVNPILQAVSWFYIWIFRGTPIYTQLVFWGLLSVLYPKFSLGVPFGPQWFAIDTNVVLSAFRAAVLGLALNEAAYLAEIVRSGLTSVDPGQTEAAMVLGMKPGQILRRIVLPQAMRVIVPPTGNEAIGMLKTTSLVLAVPFTLDLQFATESIANTIYKPIPLLLVAAFWYLLITTVLMVGQHYLERYYGRGFDGRHRVGRQQAINASHTTPEALPPEVEL